MRATHLLFLVAVLAIAGLIAQTLRSGEVSAETENLIREAVREAVAQEFRAREEAALADEETSRAYLRAFILEALAEEQQASAALRDAERLAKVDSEAERRHEQLKKANADALVVDALRIASDVQAWKLKPRAFGGGGHLASFEGLRFEDLGYPVEASNAYENLHGAFALTTEDGVAFIVATNSEHQNKVTVTIRGTQPGDISTRREHLGADTK